jgi:superfamily I DNA/RNA helicase
LNEIIANDAYDFRDVISLKYNLLIPSTALLDIKYLFTPTMRASAYTKWHMEMSKLLFGIPNDKISCKKCAFFVKKFFKGCEETQSSYISDFISETERLELDIFLCDLATFTGNGKCITNNVPIININTSTNSNTNTTGDTNTKHTSNRNTETIESLRNIIKNSYEVKIKLNRQEERELQSINKLLGEDNDMSGKSGSLSSSGQYITMSQMFGHYMSHILTSSYMEVDYGYALTVHKSQGSTYDDVYIEYSNILSNSKIIEGSKLLYTAITRGANKLHVYY